MCRLVQNCVARLVLLILLMTACLVVNAQSGHIFNKALSDSLGADAYGMKKYVWVILKTGTVTIDDQASRDSIFKGHMSNINRLVQEKKLMIAGPLAKNDLSYRGIFIFQSDSIPQVKQWVETDPVIQSGIMEATYLNWYGSAALPMYLPYHTQIEQQKP
jgi:uncharacterized protein